MNDMTQKEKLRFYIEHGYWPGEAPREPDDLKDCYRNVLRSGGRADAQYNWRG